MKAEQASLFSVLIENSVLEILYIKVNEVYRTFLNRYENIKYILDDEDNVYYDIHIFLYSGVLMIP